MKRFRDCQYSAFVSYAHADDEAHSGWISNFAGHLQKVLPGRLRGAAGPSLQPLHLSGRNGPVGGLLSAELQANVANSYAMIIVAGENYVGSEWCLKELEYFSGLFGTEGFAKRLYVVALTKPAIDELSQRPTWKALVPADLVWMNFYMEEDPERPVRRRLDNGELSERFETQVERLLKRLVPDIREDLERRPPPRPQAPEPPERPGGAGRGGAGGRRTLALAPGPVLVGVPAPELQPPAQALAARLRGLGLQVQELAPDSLDGDFEEFDAAATLVLPFGSGGSYLRPYKFAAGGHLAAQRDAWLAKGRPAAGLLWLDLRGEPCDAPPGKGHDELVAAVADGAWTPQALADAVAEALRPQPMASAIGQRVDGTSASGDRINIYIESNEKDVDVWWDLGERIKSKWREMLRQPDAPPMPPMQLHARGLPLQKIDEEPLDDADGVVLLWGQKAGDSLRAQIRKVESRLPPNAPPGIVAYLIPQQPDPQRMLEAAYWKVLRFQDADSSSIDIVPPEADRLHKFLRSIMDRSIRRRREAAQPAAETVEGAA